MITLGHESFRKTRQGPGLWYSTGLLNAIIASPPDGVSPGGSDGSAG